MYKLIEYSNNYSNKSGSLLQFTRDEVWNNNADSGVDDIGIFNSQSFKYKAAIAGKTVYAANGNSFVCSIMFQNVFSIYLFK